MAGVKAGWMVGTVPEGLAIVGADHVIEVPLPRGAAAAEKAAPLLTGGASEEELASALDVTREDARELVSALAELGAFASPDRPGDEPGANPTEPLVSAILASPPAGGGVARLIATADELLVLPAGLDGARSGLAIRDFVAGLRPVARRRAYCHALGAGRRTVLGDAPEPAVVRAALDRAKVGDPHLIRVLGLRGAEDHELEPERAGRVGAGSAHRLGTVLRTANLANDAVDEVLRTSVVVADHALANLDRPEHPRVGMETKGTGHEREHAELVARAEAAERFAGGDAAAVELVRRSAEELGAGIVHPRELFAENERQRERELRPVADLDPREPRAWVRARSLLDPRTRVWVPAEAVLSPWLDPRGVRRVYPGSSNGLAAGPDPEGAVLAALRELVERDAFMWTWVQRVSRERIAHGSLPDDLRRGIEAMRGRGFKTALLNLTLETDPVILCALHAPGTMTVGASCDPDPVAAARGAFREAAVSRLAFEPPEKVTEVRDVVVPADHEAFYRSGGAAEAAAFLLAGSDELDLGEVRGGPGDLVAAVAGIEGTGEPLAVALGSPRTAPFGVARAIVPGLVPISFGFDNEPLGMPLLARPRPTADGRLLGARLDLERSGPLDLHPFA